MTMIALTRVSCINPIGDLGDRNTMAGTILISDDEWYLEADCHYGNLGDVIVYRNKTVHAKGEPDNWQWYAAIPTANIKAYVVASDKPSWPQTLPLAVETDGEPEAPTQANVPRAEAARA